MQVTDSMHGRAYTLAEDVANGVLQGIGILLSIAGLTILVAFAALRGGALVITASAVFGAALIVLYTVSTVYHAIPSRVAPAFLARLDHIAIFVLIAGTYTPFALLALRGAVGWWLFAAIWTLAAAGSVLEFTHLQHRRALAVTLYLIMGWLGMITFAPLSAALGSGGTTLLLAGGAAYTLGVPFYLWRQLPFHCVLWHAFVLAGSVLHFFAILLYVVD
ncbi:MAG: hemolysin III family protein [Rhodanobacteraceae bacterium]